MYQLTLYISGSAVTSQRALRNLREVCDRYLAGMYRLAVVDVLEDPDAAERDKIIATPTLVRHFPEPIRKIVGDLSDSERLLMGLEIYRVVADRDETAGE